MIKKPSKNPKKAVQAQIKNAVRDLPKIMEEEINQAREKRLKSKQIVSGINYQTSQYKKKRTLMWVMVTTMFCVIIVMWTINLSGVFYDWNKTIQNTKLPDSLKTGKKEFDELFAQSKVVLDKLSENQIDKTPLPENSGLDLNSLAAAIADITSSTANATSTIETAN